MGSERDARPTEQDLAACRGRQRLPGLILAPLSLRTERGGRRDGFTEPLPGWSLLPRRSTGRRRKKYIVPSTLERVDWNAELVQGDLGEVVGQLKAQLGEDLYLGGVTLPLALADLGLID